MKVSIDLTCPKATEAAPYGVSLLRLLLFSPAILYAEAQPGQEASGSSFGLHANFNPAMAIVVVVLACAIIFIVFFSIFLRQCTGSSGGGPSQAVRRGGGGGFSRIASGGGRGEKLSGLDRTAIDAFPILLYSAAVKGLKTGAGGVPECAVCLSEFDGGETLRLLPKCDHAFHPDCISLWLSSHTTCPVCRSNLSQPEDSGDAAGDLTETSASNQSDRNPRSGLGGEPRAHHISISVYGEERGESRAVEAVSATQTRNLTRSHSTGHSLSRVQPPAAAEDWETHALSLPEDVRRKLTRAASSGGGIYRGASVPLSDGRGLTEA